MSQRIDICVIGTGLVGVAAALALAQKGWRVGLVGPLPSPSLPGRTIALFEEGSIPLLRTIGVWEDVQAEASPIKTIQIIDDIPSLFRTPQSEFHAHEIGRVAFGWNIENDILLKALLAKVHETPSLSFWPETLASFQDEAGGKICHLTSGLKLHTPLIVGADGQSSFVRTWAGIATTHYSAPQMALTAFVRHDGVPHRHISTEFHTRQGPCTLVPLPSPHMSSLVWMMHPQEAKRRVDLPRDLFAQELAHQTHHYLGAFTLQGDIGCLPIGTRIAQRIIGSRLALLGDAAHAIPPIGAQGLNLGLRDVAILVAHLDPGKDPGEATLLEAYAQERRWDIYARVFGICWLNQLLLSSSFWGDAVRGLGFTCLTSCSPFKRAFMRSGMGGS